MAPIGLTMIARGAERTLPACLDTLKDYCDPIVIALAGTPVDDTEAVARRYTPHVFPWEGETLPDGGTAHFGRAREFSLQKLAELTGPDYWFLWVDADDVVEGAEQMDQLCQEAAEKGYQGIWLPYMYSFLPDGSCNTLFDRERLIYNPTFFNWRNRVHEVIVPHAQVRWTRSQRTVIRHNHEAGGSRSQRNLTLLRMMHEENPGDKRVLYYMGHQHFADRDYQKAAEWYARYVEVSDNKLEMWHAYLYLADCLRKLEKLEEAMAAAMAAVGMYPEYKDGWYQAAITYSYRSEWDYCLLFAQIGHEREVPPRILFINPLEEVGYNVGLFEEVSLFQKGELDAALEKVRALRQITDTPHLQAKEASYVEFVESRDKAEAWLGVLDGQPVERVAELGRSIPRKLYNIPEVRDAVFGARLALRRQGLGSGRHVAFFCGPTIESWTPSSLNEGGIGGSETACIEIARRFRDDGWQVDVFNDCAKAEGEHEGVHYWQHGRFPWKDPYDLVVAWRQPRLADLALGGKRVWLWMHDLHAGDALTPERAGRFERVLGVSGFHAFDYLPMLYPHLTGRTEFVPNGIDLGRFADPGLARRRDRLVWGSSPDRGLDVLLTLWPNVRQVHPEAELHVFYGFNNLEKLAEGNPQVRLYVDRLRHHMDKPGVVDRGRVGQDVLAQELWQTGLFAYPSSFLETFCIMSLESMAAGVPVVASGIGAIPEVVGDIDQGGAGLLLRGHCRNDWYLHNFLGYVFLLMGNDEWWRKCSAAGLERAKRFTWDRSYEKWRKLLA